MNRRQHWCNLSWIYLACTGKKETFWHQSICNGDEGKILNMNQYAGPYQGVIQIEPEIIQGRKAAAILHNGIGKRIGKI